VISVIVIIASDYNDYYDYRYGIPGTSRELKRIFLVYKKGSLASSKPLAKNYP
jgi:hypothetical protein